jgi:hypothetical protein
VQFRKLMISILKTRIQKSMIERRQRCEPVPKSSEAIQCLDTYQHFVSGIPDMPKSIMRNLWKVENFASKASKKKLH